MQARSSLESNRPSRAPRLSTLLTAAALAAFAPAVCGCEVPISMLLADEMGDSGNDEPYDSYPDDGYYGDDYGSESVSLQVKNATVQGDLGEAVGFAGAARMSDAHDSGNYTDITIWADGNSTKQWSMMSALNISNGGLRNPVFKPGAKLHFSSEDYESVPYVYSWGCSGTGSDAEAFDYEAGGTETDIVVSEAEDPGMIHLSFTIRFQGYDSQAQIVRGELDVAQPL